MTTATKSGSRERQAAARRAWNLMYELFMANRPAFMAVCREYDLYPPQVMAIRHLEEPKSMRQIAEMLACDSSNVTGITDRLEERDLVKRTASEHDRRVKLLVLTPKGEKIRREMTEKLTSPPEALESLPIVDLLTLEGILTNARAAQEEAPA
jgi:DNA-binding MarR family transcriptional regulator